MTPPVMTGKPNGPFTAVVVGSGCTMRVTVPANTTSAPRAARDDGIGPPQLHAHAVAGRDNMRATTITPTLAVRVIWISRWRRSSWNESLRLLTPQGMKQSAARSDARFQICARQHKAAALEAPHARKSRIPGCGLVSAVRSPFLLNGTCRAASLPANCKFEAVEKP